MRTKQVRSTSKSKDKLNVQADGARGCLQRSRSIAQTSSSVLVRCGPMTAQNLQSAHWGIVGGDPAGPAKRYREGPSESTGGRSQASVSTPCVLTRGVNVDWKNRRCVGADSNKGVHSRRSGIGRPNEADHKRLPACRVSLASIVHPLVVFQGLPSLRLKQRLALPAANIKPGGRLLIVSFLDDNAVLRDLALEETGAQRNRQGRVPGIQTVCEPGKRKQKPQRVASEESDGTGVERACQLVSAKTSNTRETWPTRKQAAESFRGLLTEREAQYLQIFARALPSATFGSRVELVPFRQSSNALHVTNHHCAVGKVVGFAVLCRLFVATGTARRVGPSGALRNCLLGRQIKRGAGEIALRRGSYK